MSDSETVKSTYAENLKKLDIMAHLEKNWDGYNADPIPLEVIDNALTLLNKVKDYNPNIFPTKADSVQFEWYNDKNEYLEVEVQCNGNATIFSTRNSHTIQPETNVVYKEIPFDVIDIENYVKLFLNGELLI